MEKTFYTKTTSVFGSFLCVLMLSLGMTFVQNNLHAQVEHSFNTDIYNDCTSNTTIDAYAKGILSNTDNCISFDNTNATRTIAEVWIQQSQCSGGNFPAFITISSGGEDVDVAGIIASQNSASSVQEMLFRIEFDGSDDEVCLTDLSGCVSTSIVVYVEKTVNKASSSLSFVNAEIDDNFTPSGQDDCVTRTLQIGGSELNQDIKVIVPVHEKANDGRTARITATAFAANGTFLSQEVQTFSGANAGAEAALFEFFFNNLSGIVATVQLNVCSPDGNGDSFGVGGVVISSENGCQIAPLCPIPPKATINASEISWAEYAGADVIDCTTGSNASAATYDELTQNPIPTINPVTGEQVNVTMAWSGATNCESGLIRSLNGGENQVFNLSLDGTSVDDCSQLTVTFDSPVQDLCMRLIDVDLSISTTVNWQDQVTISPVPDMVENATNTSYDGNGTLIGQANCDSPIDLCNSNLYFAGPLTQITFDYCYGPDVVAADPARQIINFDGLLFTPVSQTPLEISCDNPSVELFGNTLSDGSSYSWSGPNNFSSSNQDITVTTPGVYTLVVVDPDGCDSEITYEVLDDTEIPSISASNDGPLTCTKTSVTLTGSTNGMNPTYEWRDASGALISTDANTSVSEPGTYTLTVENTENGCTNTTQTIVLEDVTPPGAVASNNGPITCDNPSVEITGSATASDVSYAWTGPAGFVSSSQTASVSVPGTYSLVITDNINGCTSNASTSVGTDINGPQLFVNTDTITCLNPCVNISVNSPIQNLTYQWFDLNGNQIGDTRVIEVCSPGIYSVIATNPDNGCTSQALLSVTEIPCGDITGTVFEDTNNDDIGDEPIEGVVIKLIDVDGNVVAMDTTDADGDYSFENVPPGDYSIMENDPDGFTSVTDNMIPVAVVPGETSNDNDFIDERLGSISGTVLQQIIADGDVIAEIPNEGVVVNLLDEDGNIIATETTDANGDYLFDELNAGDYTVQEVDPDGFASVRDEDTSEDGDGALNTDTNDNLIPVVLMPGEDDEDNDFVDVPTSEISGTVLEDTNGDGMGDTPIEGVVITLTDENGNVVGTDITDENGDYSFEDLTPGEYTITEMDPDGFDSVSDVDGANDNTIEVTLDSGASSTDNDFVDEQLGSIAGTVLEDTNGDGMGDTPIEGVIVTLLDDMGNVIATDTTDANGDYSFPDLQTGDYTVVETDPNGFTSVTPNEIPVSLDPGEDSEDNDFIDEQVGDISGTVLEDTDGDGIGDTPIEGVIVTLLDDMGNVIATDTTDVNGDYSFDGINPGDYTIVETDPDGFTSVTPNEIPVTLTPGGSSTDNDFVDEILGSISGTVLEQIIADGDVVGEIPNEGVVVNLLDEDGNIIATETTDADGNYLFNGLNAGNYTVQEVDPGGFSSVRDEDTSEDGDGGLNTDTNDNLIPVVLMPGEDDEDNDFVDVPTSEISGTVLEDTNGDGMGDTPIEGVVITLTDENGNVVATDTTDANGDYSFEDLTPGDYTITETDPDGYDSVSDVDGANDNTIEVTLDSGTSSTDNDFVDEQLGSIAGTVLEDTDGDGMGDTPIEGVIVTLLDEDGLIVATDTTDVNGDYSFPDLQTGDYTVVETDPDGFTSVTPNEIPVSLDPGEDSEDNDFVDEQLGAVSGFVLEDTNNDDVGDIPIEGVVINLVDENGNVVDTDTTDAGGAYNFDNVAPGEYTVEEVDLNGYDSVSDEDTSDDGDTTPNTDTNDNSIPVTVDPNESDDDNIFVDEQLGAITGNVSEDTDDDGQGEEPIEGVVVTLLDDMGNVIATDTTDANGDYSFEDLPAGDYTVVEEDPDGFTSVTPNEIPVTLEPGEVDENNDFVDEQTAEISGTVLEDLDGDGIGDEPIEGVIITLLDDMGNVVAIDTTDENGDYSFDDVLPGDYTIVETDPDGYDSVTPNEIPVTLNPGESSVDNDFVDEQPGSISGKVEEDTDGDGLGDTPINNVTVVLFDDAGNPIDTFVTGPTGIYEFTDVAPGEYTVVETDPTDYLSVSDEDASDDGDTTPNTNMNDNSIPVTVDSGEADDDNNFVDERPASISGTVTEDIDGDDVGEDPIEGVIITLLDENGAVVATDTTDANGDYSFEDLSPGMYTVEEQDPEGFASVNDVDGGDPNSISVDLGPGENSEDNDFVDEALGSISGNVSEDTDGDGMGDEPLEGVIVNLLDENGDVIATDTTDANGDYNFPNLPEGDYTVVEMDPDGYDSVTPNEIPVVLDAGEDSTDNDFVDEVLGSVSGFVLEDTNNDDTGDIPIEGVVVDLVDENGNVVDTDTTDAGGFFSFDNVSPGEYTVEETDLDGFASVADEDTSDDGDTTPNTDTNDNSIPVTVDPGEMDDDNIFVDEQLGAITGNVSLDTDNDDQGEEPIEGVIITLLDDMGNVVATDTTDANGDYAFEDLPAGDYTVVEMDPDGLTSVTPNEIPVTLDPGEIDENNDFIDEPTTDVSGTVLEDIDGDGIGDEPIEGVVVELLDDMGNVIATDTTDENGDYNFEDVEPGDYTIVETDPDGYDSVTPNEIPVTVMPGMPSTDNDFVDEQPGSVSGNVSEDTDGDEMGDTPIEGVVVNLVDDMGNVVDTDTTDANGDYMFDDVTPGEYTVEEVDPMDYESISDEDTSDDGDSTPNTDMNDNSIPVTVTPGEADEDNDFVDGQFASISGNVSEDTNGDGVADLPLEGVVVNLLDEDGLVVDMDTTDADGNYSFEAVVPGDYTVEEVDPTDYVSVSDEDTSDDGDTTPNTDMNDNSIPVTATVGESDEDNNFIDELPGSISGNVSEDTDGDGAGDSPLENVVVNLVDDMGTVVATDSTDANGDYNFDNVTPGEYTVEEVDPDGLGSVSDEDTSDDGDTTPNTDMNDNSIPVTLLPGEADDDNNFVDETTLTAGIGNRVWEDLNNNGLQDDGEPGINGALVSLFEIVNGGLVPVGAQVTTGDGNYLFTNLDPNKTYVLSLQNPDPTAYFFTATDQGDDTLDSDFNPVPGLEATLASTSLITSLIENSIDSTYDAGLVPFGSISGNVSEDLDDDDIADQALENVIVILTDGNTGAEVLRDTTDADGNYEFNQVLPGEYVIVEEDPTDYASVSDEDVSDDGDLVANTDMNDNEIPVTLEPGEADDDNNFVDEVLVTTIFGHIYFDSNGNGVQDGFEPNIPNLDVIIQQSDGSFITATTDDEGNWSSPVLPGLTISTIDTTDFDYPTGAIQTEGTLSETNVVMEGTMFDAGIDGFFIPTTVFGVVYYDSNDNGDQDADEPGLEGIEVIIMDDSGMPQTVVTDSLGNWSANVIPGMVEALVDTDNPVLPSAAEQTEGDNPTTITAILGLDNDMGNDGYFFCVDIDVQVLLQGSLIESSYQPASPDGLMRTELNMRRFLPGQDNRFIFADDTPAGQPYNMDPWAYMGEEGAAFDFTVTGDPQAGYPLDVTDWVLVSLRSTIFPDSEICKRAALLQSDGQIIFIEEFDCCGTLDPNQAYYIVIEHRNHVPVMTPIAVSPVDGVISFDFRAQESYTGIFGSATGQAVYDFPGGSVFCMVSGNPDQVGPGDAQDVNVSDIAIWSQQSGLDTGYYLSDVNMDGDINSDDRAIIENNFGNTSGIPFNY